MNDAQTIVQLLGAKRIAVVGLSDDPAKVSYHIGQFLIDHGKDVVPVNPSYETVLGRRCYAKLEDVPGKVDLVNVFRRPEFCADVVKSAIAIGAGGVWLQLGIRNENAKKLAERANMPFVQDRCIKIEFFSLSPEGRGPG
jgi:predicted CoA-binding protein